MVRNQVFLYGITALISFLIFLSVFAPASLAFKFFQDDIAQIPDTSIFQITGSVWNGSADVQYRNFPNSKINWKLAPNSILEGSADLTFIASGESHELTGQLLANGYQGKFLGLQGKIDSTYINQVGKNHGIIMSGTFELKDINLTVDKAWFSLASGAIDWTGGKIMYQTGNGRQSVNLPPLKGVFTVKEQKLILYVYNEGKSVFSIHLQRDGWVSLRFNQRFLSLAGLLGGENFDPDTVIFTIEEKIL